MQNKVNIAGMKDGIGALKRGKAFMNVIHKAKHLSEEKVPIGTLSDEQLNLRLSFHQGLLGTASILAFDPIQRLLAVASVDGRIKIFGGAGVEALFQSVTRAPCKFLKFISSGQLVYINAENDVEVWDLEKQTLGCSLRWESKITAFNELPGTQFMYIGNEFGTVSVVQFSKLQRKLTELPYAITAKVTLGGLVRDGSRTAPSVISILPQVDAEYSRLVIVYENGLFILWDLHEKKVIAVRGGTKKQREILTEHFTNLHEQAERPSEQLLKAVKNVDEDVGKEICAACWAWGNSLCIGYMNGDVWIWSTPSVTKDKTRISCPFISGEPLQKLETVPAKSTRMPIFGIAWSGDLRASKSGGRLYVVGGREVDSPEVLTVLSMDGNPTSEKLPRLELLLHGPFRDLAILPNPGGASMAALVVLTSPGQLHLYDEAGIASCFSSPNESGSLSSLVPVTWPAQLPSITAIKFALLPQQSAMHCILRQSRRSTSDVLPSSLPAGTQWPVTGGEVNPCSFLSKQDWPQTILITGLKSGQVHMWDASMSTLQLLQVIEVETDIDASPVSALAFCPFSQNLAVGNEQGKVSLYSFSAESSEINFRLVDSINAPQGSVSRLNAVPGFQRTLVLSVHQSEICSLTIANKLQRLASGDVAGVISLFDLATWTLLHLSSKFVGKVNRNISSIAFAIPPIHVRSSTSPMSQSGSRNKSFSPVLPFGPRSKPSSPTSPSFSSPVIFIANKEGFVDVIDADTGCGILSMGPVNLKQSSTAIAMYLLDSNGAPLKEMEDKGKEVGAGSPFPTGLGSEASYVLLCLEESLRLYSTSTIFQGSRKTLRKVKFQTLCSQAFPFECSSTHSCGLLLLFKSGLIEIRSLPDLGLVQERNMTSLAHCDLEFSSPKLSSSTRNGHLALVHSNLEIFGLSTLSEQNKLRLPDPCSKLFGRNLSTASEAVLDSPTPESKRKSLLGGFIKELKSGAGQPLQLRSSVELGALFASRFVIPMSIDSEFKDDIDVDSDEPATSSPIASKIRKEKLVNRLRKSLKASKENNDGADNRSIVPDENQDDLSLQVRSADAIKVKYGHKPSTGPMSVAAINREMLIEREHRLQAVNNQAEEMQEAAGEFASIAAELARRVENRKWYEL